MAPTAPRYLIPLSLLLLVAALVVAPWTWLRWGLVVTFPLLAIALWDFFQHDHTLRRNYPLISRIRWIMEDLRPYLRSYVVESNLEGRPFSHEERELVYARAKGELDSHPFGTEYDVYSEEYEWLGHSMRPNAEADAEWRMTIGGPDTPVTYDSALLNISAMSFGSISAKAIQALNKGAAAGNFAHNTGEGGISPYHRSHGGDLIWEIGSGYFGCRTADGSFDPELFAEQAGDKQVKMIEIKLSQGAKPGHGGVLPGTKVTEEIARTRGVPAGKDVISPAAHSTFSTPEEMLQWLAELRKMSGGKPVGLKLCVGQIHEVFAIGKAMHETGVTPDYLLVDGAEGGTGAAPLELSNSIGTPLREGLVIVRNMLVGMNLKDRVALGAAGKIHSGASLATAFAIGADFCNAARAFMFSLGCVQSMKCHTGECPTGIATQEDWRQQGLVIADKSERVVRFQRHTLHALREIVVAMGHQTPWDIRPEDMRERLDGARACPLDEIHDFLAPGELLDDPEATRYARAWRQARPDTFRKAI